MTLRRYYRKLLSKYFHLSLILPVVSLRTSLRRKNEVSFVIVELFFLCCEKRFQLIDVNYISGPPFFSFYPYWSVQRLC